jgi:iron complex outermembrane recepter protein
VELDGMVRRIGAIDNLGVPAYTELYMRLGWRMNPSLDLSLVGRNLLHDSHGEFGPTGRLQIERSVYAMLTWQP